MRDRYWATYSYIKHASVYYQCYSIRSKRINGTITSACIVFSCTSLASLTIWDHVPWLWIGIVIAMQFIQALSPHLPFSQQITAIKCLLPELNDLLLDIDREWLNIDNYDDKKIKSLIDNFERKYANLCDKYIGDTYFPSVKSCDGKALLYITGQ